MVANRNDSLLSQFSRSSPDDGSAPDGVCPALLFSIVATLAAVSDAELVTLPLCSSFSSIRSKLVRRVLAADGGTTAGPPLVGPECYAENDNKDSLSFFQNIEVFEYGTVRAQRSTWVKCKKRSYFSSRSRFQRKSGNFQYWRCSKRPRTNWIRRKSLNNATRSREYITDSLACTIGLTFAIC